MCQLLNPYCETLLEVGWGKLEGYAVRRPRSPQYNNYELVFTYAPCASLAVSPVLHTPLLPPLQKCLRVSR